MMSSPNSQCHFKKKKKYSAAAYSAASQRCLSVLMCVSSAYGREAVKLWLWQNLNNSCCWPNYGTSAFEVMCLNQLNDKLGVCALKIYRVWKQTEKVTLVQTAPALLTSLCISVKSKKHLWIALLHDRAMCLTVQLSNLKKRGWNWNKNQQTQWPTRGNKQKQTSTSIQQKKEERDRPEVRTEERGIQWEGEQGSAKPSSMKDPNHYISSLIRLKKLISQ